MNRKKFIIVSCVLVVIIVGGLLLFIKRSNNKQYVYDATLNDNMINYNLVIEDGKALSGDLYSMDGEWLAELKDGEAVINETDISKFPKFKIKIKDEVFIITKK